MSQRSKVARTLCSESSKQSLWLYMLKCKLCTSLSWLSIDYPPILVASTTGQLEYIIRYNITLCSCRCLIKQVWLEPSHAKTGLNAFVVALPKDGWIGRLWILYSKNQGTTKKGDRLLNCMTKVFRWVLVWNVSCYLINVNSAFFMENKWQKPRVMSR